jgi:mono/diheme cytochrome c family protein
MKNLRALKLSALGGIVVIASVVLIFVVVDFSALAEPSSAERQIATNALSLKIHLSRPERTALDQFDAGSLQHGLEVFQRSCAFCHGSADGTPGSFANTLSPRPPQFFRDARPIPVWQAAYIIRRGVRWTGMPAFPNLSDRDAWLIASMLESKKGNLEGK